MAARSTFGSVEKRPSGKHTKFRAKYRIPVGLEYPKHLPRDVRAPHLFLTKAEAQSWLQQERRDMRDGLWIHPKLRVEKKTKQLTVAEWIDRFHTNLEREVKPSTLQTYRKSVRTRVTDPVAPGDRDPKIKSLAQLQLAAVTKADIYRWWDAVSGAYPDTPETNRKAYRRLRAAFAEAMRREMIVTNPVDVKAASRSPVPEEKYLPKDEEINAILQAMSPRYRAVTSLMLFHGLRIGEALAVEYADVKVQGAVPYSPRVTVRVKQNAQRITPEGESSRMVIQSVKTKAGNREVPIMAAHVPMFLEHLAQHAPKAATDLDTETGPRKARLLTTTEQNRILFDTAYRSILNNVEDRAGVTRKINPHSGRRWLITRLAEQGAHVKEIGAVLGQDDVSTIMNIYMLVRAERPMEMMDRVSCSLGASA